MATPKTVKLFVQTSTFFFTVRNMVYTRQDCQVLANSPTQLRLGPHRVESGWGGTKATFKKQIGKSH